MAKNLKGIPQSSGSRKPCERQKKKKRERNTDKNHLEKTINIQDRYSRVSMQNYGFHEIQNETKSKQKKYLNLTSLADYNDGD